MSDFIQPSPIIVFRGSMEVEADFHVGLIDWFKRLVLEGADAPDETDEKEQEGEASHD